jgi:hypothetical protein
VFTSSALSSSAKVIFQMLKKQQTAEPQWPMPVILATQEAEIRRIKVQSQPRQKKTVRETLS